jgi:RHS repeat-associated protein
MTSGNFFKRALILSAWILATPAFASASAADAGATRTQLADGRWLSTGAEADVSAIAKLDDVAVPMVHARRDHSATLMPDGRVLIWGGVDAHGRIVTEGEWFDPRTNVFSAAGPIDLIPRAGHRAVLQVDGRLLMIGGRADGLGEVERIEAFDARRNHGEVLAPASQEVRSLLLWERRPAANGGATEESFAARGRSHNSPITLAARHPAASAQSAPLDTLIGLQFTAPVAATFWKSHPPSLIGPRGQESFDLVPAEDGTLLFITPKQELLPASRYTVVYGGTSAAGSVPSGTIEFHTERVLPARPDARVSIGESLAATTRALIDQSMLEASSTNKTAPAVQVIGEGAQTLRTRRIAERFRFSEPASSDPDFWVPSAANLDGQWRTGRDITAAARTQWSLGLSRNEREKAWRSKLLKSSGTSISGVIYGISDRPLAGARLTLGDRTTVTDKQGRYRFEGIVAGRQQLVVDGRSVATQQGDSFGQFVLGIDAEAGKETPLNPIYLPKIRAQDWIDIESPLRADITIRTPLMPGFSVHLPKGTVLRDREGKVVRRVAVVPMPLDRVAINYPVNTPLHMTFQPAGLQVEGLTPGVTDGIRFVYPNYAGAEPGRVAEFLNYDPIEKGWYAYGTGRVSDDGLYVVPDARTQVYKATGFGIILGPEVPPETPQTCPALRDEEASGTGADPVDLRTGLFLHHASGPALGDKLPVQVTTTYRPGDTVSRDFGKGVFHSYSHYLYKAGDPHTNWSEFWLVLPDCSKLPFRRTSAPALDYAIGYTAIADQVPGAWYGAKMVLQRNVIGLAEYQVLEITRRDGLKLVFTLQGGYLLQIADRHGNRIELTRIGGALTRITGPSGRHVDLVNGTGTRISSIADMGGRSWQYTYDANARLTRITYPDNSFENYVFDSNGRMQEVWDRRGNRMVLNQYDANGRVIHQTLSDGGTYQLAYTVGGDGKVSEAQVTDPDGSTRRVRFHASGWMSEDTEALGTALERTTNYERNTLGFLLARVDPLGRRTEFAYDAEQRLTGKTVLAGTANALTSSMVYNASHDPISSTDPEGRTSTFLWDSRRRLQKVIDYRQREITYAYDSLDRVTSITDPEQRMTTFSYQLYDLVRVTDAEGSTVKRYVDALGRTQSITDEQGRSVALEYDTLDRVIVQRAPDGSATSFSYDPMGNLKTLTDASLSITRWDYDSRQRPIKRTDALNEFETWSYNEAARTVTHTDRRLRNTTYAYDALGRQSQLTYHDGTQIDFGYDIGDRLISLDDDASGLMSFGYNIKDQLVSETTPTGTVAYSFDTEDRLSAVTPSGLTATAYGYDTLDRLTSLTQGSDLVQFGYDAQDRRNLMTLPNGVITEASFDTKDRLSALTYKKGSTTLGTLTYGYDEAGQLIERGGSWGETSLPTATTANATTDANHRLTSFNATTLSYDDNGNLIDDGTRQYLYDIRDRLVEIQQGSTTLATFQYDTFGRRISKTVNGTTIAYRYDGDNAIAEIEGAATRTLFTGPGIDERYARDNETGGRSYFLTDALGSTMALTAANGDVQARYGYEAYGETSFTAVAPGFTSGNPYQYTGRENDGDGLYYYRARYYSTGQKRFLAEDPLGFVDGPNPFAYVGGNPLQYRDPLGLWAWGDPLPQWMVDGAAGYGDTLSFGGSRAIRWLFGWDGGVNTCSKAYGYGEWAGIGHSLAFGGAHLGRNALNQAGKGGLIRGVKRLINDGRTWGSVRDTWSLAAGGGQRWLRANGQSLHHWLVPQRFAKINAGFNYLPISAGFNSWMNGSTGLRIFVEWGFRGSVLGIYGAPITATVSDCGCQ